MFIFLSLTAIIILFALSAFWSVAETGMTSLSKYRIKKIIALNKSLSEDLKAWLKYPYNILTTVLVVDTITNFGISFLSMIVALRVFHFAPREAVEIGTWLAVTLVAVIFGEIAPKIFGRFNPEKATIISLPVLSSLTRIISPLAWPFVMLVKLVFPKKNIVPVSRLTYVSMEEIKGLISEARTSGMLGKEAGQMLERVLRLSEISASQIMTPVEKLEAVNIEHEEEKFLDMAVETGRSRVPVYRGSLNKMVGFVYTKDLLNSWRKHNGVFSSSMIRPAYFVPPDKKICDVLRDFQSGQTHMAFVADAFGDVKGIVTLEDVLEEIVGEILDEYDLRKKV